MRLLVTGAAGNLGSILSRHLLAHTAHALRLMVHNTDLPPDLDVSDRVESARADLGRPETLADAVSGVDVIVHFAGVLFKARPEKFLPVTNTRYFMNLVDAATSCGVKRVVLISFPHVEGPSSVEHPARGRLDGDPLSVHARTRLEEERYLFDNADAPVSLRVGMVYGMGILMIDAARWLARRRLLGVWKERTQIHLVSTADFCAAVTGTVDNADSKGIYHIGDDGNDSLQEFLRIACEEWGAPPPLQMPLWLIYAAAGVCELVSWLFRVKAPLTRDFITIGRAPYYGDTTRMKDELLPTLQYPTIHEGRVTLKE